MWQAGRFHIRRKQSELIIVSDQFNPYAAPSLARTYVEEESRQFGAPIDSLRGVAAGMTLMRYSLLAWAAAMGLLILLNVCLSAGPTAMGWTHAINAVYRGASLGALVLALAGRLRCLSTPPESDARGWIIASLAFFSLRVVVVTPSLVGIRISAAVQTWQLTELLAWMASVAFCLYLRKIALFVARADHARRAVTLLIIEGVQIGILAGIYASWQLLFLIGVAKPGAAGVGLAFYRIETIANGCYFILEIVLLVKFFTLLGAMRAVIRGR